MNEYVTVERADNEAMAELIKQRLEQGGIPCIVESGRMAAVAGAGAARWLYPRALQAAGLSSGTCSCVDGSSHPRAVATAASSARRRTPSLR